MTPRFTEQRVLRWPGPWSLGPYKIIGAIANNGKQYTAQCSNKGADTFFSIPARIKVKGKTVSGYVTTEEHFCWTCGGNLMEHRHSNITTYDDDTGAEIGRRTEWYCKAGSKADFRETWLFRAYHYGKNAKLVMPRDWLSPSDLARIAGGEEPAGRHFRVRATENGRVVTIEELDSSGTWVFVASLDLHQNDAGNSRERVVRGTGKPGGFRSVFDPPKVIRRGKGY